MRRSRSPTSPCWRGSCSTPRRSSACPRSTSRGCWSGCSRCWPAATSGASGSGTSQSWWAYVQADRALGGVPPLPRRRADADARRRAGEGDERAHRRADPRAAAARPLARGRARRPRARRADLRRLDRALAGAPAVAAASTCGWATPVEGLVLRDGRIAAATVGGALGRRPTTTSPRCPSRSCAALLSPELRARRAAPERARPPGHALDERDHVLPRARTCRSSAATRSTSTPNGR